MSNAKTNNSNIRYKSVPTINNSELKKIIEARISIKDSLKVLRGRDDMENEHENSVDHSDVGSDYTLALKLPEKNA